MDTQQIGIKKGDLVIHVNALLNSAQYRIALPVIEVEDDTVLVYHPDELLEWDIKKTILVCSREVRGDVIFRESIKKARERYQTT